MNASVRSAREPAYWFGARLAAIRWAGSFKNRETADGVVSKVPDALSGTTFRLEGNGNVFNRIRRLHVQRCGSDESCHVHDRRQCSRSRAGGGSRAAVGELRGSRDSDGGGYSRGSRNGGGRMMAKVCASCGSEFTPRYGKQRYCCRSCAGMPAEYVPNSQVIRRRAEHCRHYWSEKERQKRAGSNATIPLADWPPKVSMGTPDT